MLKRWIAPILALLLCAGCGAQPEYTADFFTMDTYCSVTICGSQAAAQAIEAEGFRLNSLLDPADSQLAQLNQAADGTAHKVSSELLELLLEGQALSRETGGLCDITAGALTQAWGFSTGKYRLPDQGEIDRALSTWGKMDIREEDGTVTLPEGGVLALGAFAKGMAADRCAKIARDEGVTSGLIRMGGSIAALGKRPDGTDWRVAVRDPNGNTEQWVGILSLSDTMVSTSGGYERFFEQDGITYHHILDPHTGYPAQTDLTSVTVVSSGGARSDAFSTALFILGEQAALERVESDQEMEAVLVTKDGRVVVTAGLKDSFTFTGGDYGYTLEQRG